MQIFPGSYQTLEGLCGCHPSCSCSQVGPVQNVSCELNQQSLLFWHLGLVSWKAVFHRLGWEGGLGMLPAHCIYYTAANITGLRVKEVMQVMGSSCRHRKSFTLMPTPIAHLLLCSPCPVPNSPELVLVRGQGFLD